MSVHVPPNGHTTSRLPLRLPRVRAVTALDFATRRAQGERFDN